MLQKLNNISEIKVFFLGPLPEEMFPFRTPIFSAFFPQVSHNFPEGHRYQYLPYSCFWSPHKLGQQARSGADGLVLCSCPPPHSDRLLLSLLPGEALIAPPGLRYRLRLPAPSAPPVRHENGDPPHRGGCYP